MLVDPSAFRVARENVGPSRSGGTSVDRSDETDDSSSSRPSKQGITIQSIGMIGVFVYVEVCFVHVVADSEKKRDDVVVSQPDDAKKMPNEGNINGSRGPGRWTEAYVRMQLTVKRSRSVRRCIRQRCFASNIIICSLQLDSISVA